MSEGAAEPGRIGEALRWSGGAPITTRAVPAAALGMTVPALVGLALGRPDLGFTIGLGALLLADAPKSSGRAEDGAAAPSSPLAAAAPAALAIGLATLIAPLPLADPAMAALAGVAALISGYNRPLGVGAIRFIVYLVLGMTLLENAGPRGHGAAALVFGLGALWNLLIRLLLRPTPMAAEQAPAARATRPAQRRAHFLRTLTTLSGWQFPIRVVLGLAAAIIIRDVVPSRHYGWVVLTVALLTQRPIEHLPVKTIQRAAGTALGVALTWAVLIAPPRPAWLAAAICVLATGAALARPRNYLAYSVLATPVILLVLDLGKPIAPGLLFDRLAATLIGAAIVIGLNLAMDRLAGQSRPP